MEGQMKAGTEIAMAWKNAWSNPKYRRLAVAGTILLLGVLISFPFFFAFIEQRNGNMLSDRLLVLIPPYDVSIPTFIVIWSMTVLLWIRCVQDPHIFLLFLWCFIILCCSRMITITCFPLNPPGGLIPLKDPLTSFFYGGPDKFITKDLFYSGHTSIQFLMCLCLKKKLDKILTLLSSLTIGTLVLVQHIHYSIDVIAAFVFGYLIYRVGKMVVVY
jgi:hypothetical protein